MYDPNADEDERLRQVREDFRAASDYRSDELQEAHRAGRFYHNTLGIGQWEARDYDTLKEQGRPAFTFNLIKATIDKGVGMQRDGMRKATALPVGGEDEFVARILNILSDSFYKTANLDGILEEALEKGCIHGEGNVQLAVEIDPEDPMTMKGTAQLIPRYDIYWDPSSRRPDRSDATFFFMARWLTRNEFKKLYPEHADDFPYTDDSQDDPSDDETRTYDHSESADHFGFDADGYNYGRWTRLYYDAQRQKVRVIHCEYKVPEKRYWLVNSQTQKSERISKKLATKAREMIQLGAMQGAEVRETWGEQVYTLQFIGGKILFEGESYEPFDGFSMDAFVWSVDSETGAAYGGIRNLFDPQMEVNKSWSAGLEQYTGQSKPGVIAEKSAIEDEEQFMTGYGTNGGVSYVKDGALSQKKIIERSPATPSPATEVRNRNSIEMVQRISGVGTEMESPAAHAEAAATVTLRYHQARLAQSSVVENYEAFLVRIQKRVLQTILRVVSDQQLVRMLGNHDKYGIRPDPQTGQTMVVEYKMNPETQQPDIVNSAPIESLRDLQYDVELETVSDNGSMRLVEAQHLLELQQAGVPVPPDLLVSKATSNRYEREKMVKYAEDQGEAQRSAGEQEAQQQAQIMQETLAIEASKAEETARSNRVDEVLKAQRQGQDHAARMAAVLEQADNDEKNALLKLAEMIERRQQARAPRLGGG